MNIENQTLQQHNRQGRTVSWFKRIIGNTPTRADTPTHSTGFYDLEGQPVPLNVQGDNVRLAREMVRQAAVRTASVFGIPSNWLSYEVLTITNDEQAFFQLQISLRIWDEHLWSQSMAFEQKTLKRIREEDVNVAKAVRAVLWRIQPDAGCPYDELSGEQAWRSDAVKQRASAYERLRGELSAAMTTGLPSVITGLDTSATLPMTRSVESNFTDTYPGAAQGFDATRPFVDDGHGKPAMPHRQ
jgi:hypothetical protein